MKIKTDDGIDLELIEADMGMQTYRLVRRGVCSKKRSDGESTTKRTEETNMKEERNTSGNVAKMVAKKKRENFQKMKTKFRSTKEWKEFRRKLKAKQKVDPITLRPLSTRTNCHHYWLDPNQYQNLKNENYFVCYEHMTHKMIHFLYNVAKRRGLEPLLESLKFELAWMLHINDVNPMGEEDE